MAAKPERRGAGRGQDFRIAHLTLGLGVFLMMHGLQQSVTQAVRRYHFFSMGFLLATGYRLCTLLRAKKLRDFE